MKSSPILAAAATILLSGQLPGGTTAMPAGPEPVLTTTTDSGWQFALGLYGWAAGLDGDLGAAGYVTPVNISFSDILDTLDMTAMGAVELRNDRWLFQFEGLYLRNSVKGYATHPETGAPVHTTIIAETTRLEMVAGYHLIDNESTRLDLLAGAVYYDISNELRFIGPAALFTLKGGDEWIDPIIGLRLNQHLGGRWNLVARGEIGGFGVNADLVWQALALIGCQLTESSTLYLGWRHAAVDYQNGGFLYDVASSGPILGLVLTW